jgi:hypothetical protein
LQVQCRSLKESEVKSALSVWSCGGAGVEEVSSGGDMVRGTYLVLGGHYECKEIWGIAVNREVGVDCVVG